MEALAPLFDPNNFTWTVIGTGFLAAGGLGYELRDRLKALFRKS